MTTTPFTLNVDDTQRVTVDFAKQLTPPRLAEPIVNRVQVVLANPAATAVLDGQEAVDAGSVTTFGASARQLVTILANQMQAASLAEYLIRPLPEYWFSSLEVLLNGLPDGERDTVAELDIGDQIVVSKRFPNVTNPVVQELFVEGIEHDIAVDRHVVRLYCSPGDFYDEFLLDTSELDDPAYGLG